MLGIKVGMSAVDIAELKESKSEMPHWDFDRYQTENEAAWNKELGKIKLINLITIKGSIYGTLSFVFKSEHFFGC